MSKLVEGASAATGAELEDVDGGLTNANVL